VVQVQIYETLGAREVFGCLLFFLNISAAPFVRRGAQVRSAYP